MDGRGFLRLTHAAEADIILCWKETVFDISSIPIFFKLVKALGNFVHINKSVGMEQFCYGTPLSSWWSFQDKCQKPHSDLP
jgi:hypothetical protein